jgi:hypothetical protein
MNWVRKAGAVADCFSCSCPVIMGLQVSLLSSPVARFLVSERGDLNSSLDDDIRCTDILSFGLRSKVALDAYSDGLSDWRGACCREDAVFSRTPNWAKRGFIFLHGLCEDLFLDLFSILIVGLLA